MVRMEVLLPEFVGLVGSCLCTILHNNKTNICLHIL